MKANCIDSKTIKTCKKCGISKPLSEYYADKCAIDNHSGVCKNCWYLRSKEWIKNNPEKTKDMSTKYRNSKKGKNTQKEWRKNNPNKVKSTVSKYSKTEKSKISKRKWRQNNKEWESNYRKNRCKNDIQFDLNVKIRRRISTALNRRNINKSDKTIKLLGCSYAFYKEYLESLFTPGMTWKNKNKWHIDHKIPISSFDLTKPEEQKACFHYTNTQPLWAKDNIKKGAKTA